MRLEGHQALQQRRKDNLTALAQRVEREGDRPVPRGRSKQITAGSVASLMSKD